MNDVEEKALELTTDDINAFWSNVKRNGRTGCWEWTGLLGSDKGNGRRIPRYRKGGVDVGARRLAYRLCYGKPSGPVGTSCGNPLCVNPGHLTPQGVARHTHHREAKPLTEKVVRRIIKLRAAGKSQPAIARKTGVAQNQVSMILRMARLCAEGKLEMDREPTGVAA